VIQDVVIGKGKSDSSKKLFKTDHIRSKFAAIRRKENPCSNEDSSDEDQKALSVSESLRNKEELKKLLKDSSANHKSIRDSVALITSKTSFGVNTWNQEEVSNQKSNQNPFINSELQENEDLGNSIRESKNRFKKNKKLKASQESNNSKSYNSLIYSNENALKNIIQAHDLKIEESFGKDQIEYYNQKEDFLKRKLKESGMEKYELDVIPETDGRMNFTLKGKSPFQNKLSRKKEIEYEIPFEDDLRDSKRSTSNGRSDESEEESDPDVDYLMHKLDQVMKEEKVPQNESSLLEETNLDPKTKQILLGYFKRQDQKFKENKIYLNSTYQKLKEEKIQIEDQLGQLGDVYKRQISELEKSNKQKDQEIQKLKNKNKLLGIKKVKEKKSNKKNDTNDKYYSEKIKNLSRLLEEKNKKIKTLNNKIDDIKIDNQAMKELLTEMSGQNHG
jgi:hypothetical protein